MGERVQSVKCLPGGYKDLHSNFQCPREIPGMVAFACNPRAGEAGTGQSQELAGKPV